MRLLRWSDFDFDTLTVLIDRGVVHGRVADAKTEYSKDRVPLDASLAEVLLKHKERCQFTAEDWVFANPRTGKPYHQDSIQQDHIRKAGLPAGLGDGIGWKTFRHSYRSWLDDTGAPLTVQKELMRHASIQTTMNVYGKAMADSKRQANSKIVRTLLKAEEHTEAAYRAVAATGS